MSRYPLLSTEDYLQSVCEQVGTWVSKLDIFCDCNISGSCTQLSLMDYMVLMHIYLDAYLDRSYHSCLNSIIIISEKVIIL